MAAPAPAKSRSQSSLAADAPHHEPYVPANVEMHEFTWQAVILGALLGIVFGASSLYLVLKVGMTVSASIPVAVLSITLFRVFSNILGLRRATILENNIVQTTGSAGESIAFGVGVTMPALILLGFDMEVTRVMTVGVLGGLLGILMMIPLRRAFIVRQHGKLRYPEGTACADVLIVGEKGGTMAATVFSGFGLAFVYKFCVQAMHMWKEVVNQNLTTQTGQGLRGGVVGGELSPELLGVGYIIGPRIASMMLAGGVIAYLVIAPLIMMFASGLNEPLAPATTELVRDMSVKQIRDNYILYIGAGAVATGGIISMFHSLPLILGSLRSGLADLAKAKASSGDARTALPRTERDLPLWIVFVGAIGLVAALAAIPSLGLGLTLTGLLGAGMIVAFGFLFVTVSSRLTGEIGSSSNPISGMTVATLLMTCLIFYSLGMTDKPATLMALTIAAVVCVAASNGGTTSQDLKTGFLVGGTPRYQQLAIVIGSLTSALVIGLTLLLLNDAGTIYTTRPDFVPSVRIDNVDELTKMERAGGQYADDETTYHVLNARTGQYAGVRQGKYLVDDAGVIRYYVDPAITGRLNMRDDEWAKEQPAQTKTDESAVRIPPERGAPAAAIDDEATAAGTSTEAAAPRGRTVNKFDAPKTQLMAIIIDGILGGTLPWELVALGALIAVVIELLGVSSLAVAVGVYLPIQVSTPIFIGGMIRWGVDKLRRSGDADAEMSPGVLIASGYIAGGAIAGVLVAFFEFAPASFRDGLNMEERLPAWWLASNWPALGAFAVLALTLALTGALARSAANSGPATSVEKK